MQIGFIGFGKMGTRMVEKLLASGHEVVGWNRSPEAVSKLKSQIVNTKSAAQNFSSSETIEDLVYSLEKPRVIWLMLPAGDATENVLQEVSKYVEKGDIIVDGGNAFYKDTQSRFEQFAKKKVRYLGIGVSGGIKAADNGYPFMVGGDAAAYRYINTILDDLSKPHGGHEYFGTGGAGHFVKMVHNGIEYGMMQAIGEGFGVLEKSPYHLNLLSVAKLWQKGTIVSSFLIDCAKEALGKDRSLANIDGLIDATGEAEWTVNTAKEQGVVAENIEQSLDFRRRSKTDQSVRNSLAAKMVAALRHEFGGHDVKKK